MKSTPDNPGKYDEICELVRVGLGADAVLLIVAGGYKGAGFSACFSDPSMAILIPPVLRSVADQVEKDIKEEHEK